MKIFLTGATGFLGKSVVKRLLKDNHKLYLLTRKSPTDPIYMNNNITLINGSLENIETWANKLEGMDVVIHMAAPVVFWGEWKMYEDGIINATKNILEASEKHNVKRFVYISSESVLQAKEDILNVDATYPYPKKNNSYYGQAKQAAEKLILDDASNMTKIILRPPFIWGNGVPSLTDIVNKVKKGQFMWIDKGIIMMDMVHVDNVAEAIALTCEKGEDKDIFYITDDEPKFAKEFITDLVKTQGVDIPNKSIPRVVAKPIAAIVEGIWKLLKIKSHPPLTRFDLAFIAMHRSYNIRDAKKILGYKPVVSYQDGLKQMEKKN